MTKKCKYCGSNHTNKTEESQWTELADVCFNCDFFESRLKDYIKAVNNYKPIRGHGREIYDVSFKIRVKKI